MASNDSESSAEPLTAEAITSNQEKLTELGCLLGAFRDVSFTIGMDVLGITLVPKPPHVPTPTPETPAPPLPRDKDSELHRLKLICLIQDFCDNMFDSGYIVTRIQLKPVPLPVPGQQKAWEITVAFDEEYQHVIPPYPSRERRGQTSLLFTSDSDTPSQSTSSS